MEAQETGRLLQICLLVYYCKMTLLIFISTHLKRLSDVMCDIGSNLANK